MRGRIKKLNFKIKLIKAHKQKNNEKKIKTTNKCKIKHNYLNKILK